MYYSAIVLTIISNVAYHIVQRVTPEKVPPLITLGATYATSMVLCFLFSPLFTPPGGWVESLRKINWTSFALGVAIIGLELGFLLAYRAGWTVSTSALVSNVVVAILLLPIGALLFKEQLSSINTLGILVCLLGLVMVNWRR